MFKTTNCLIFKSCVLCALLATSQLVRGDAPSIISPTFVTRNIAKVGDKAKLEIKFEVPSKNVAGEVVPLTIDVTNQTEAQVTTGYTNGYNEWHFTLKDASGRPVPLTRLGKIVIPESRRARFNVYKIDGKAVEKKTINLSLLFDLTIGGTYELSANRYFDVTVPTPINLKIEGLKFEVIDKSAADGEARLNEYLRSESRDRDKVK